MVASLEGSWHLWGRPRVDVLKKLLWLKTGDMVGKPSGWKFTMAHVISTMKYNVP